MKKYFLLPAFILIQTFAYTQTAEIGVLGGLTYYLGDINPGIHFLASKPAYGLIARVNVDSRWTFKAEGVFGRIKGDDAIGNKNDRRGLSFESKITDISVSTEFNFFDYFTGSRKNTLTPFIFGGVGVVIYNPKAGGVDLRSIGTEGQNAAFEGRAPYSKVTFTIPFGLGFKYSINRRLGFTVEWGMRKTFSDYLDDVSTTYYLDGSQLDPSDPAEILSDPTQLHQPMQERGNPSTKDWYNFTGISLTYKFRLYNKNKCPNQWKSDYD
jgi:hypothetical protein